MALDRKHADRAIPQMDAKLDKILKDNVIFDKKIITIQKEADDLYKEYAIFKELTVGKLEAVVADITYLRTFEADVEYLKAHNVTTDYLQANYTTTEGLEAGYANINFANVDAAKIDQAWITNLLVQGSILTNDINAATGSFSHYLTGVNIVGDIITAGTIATDRLLIRDPDTDEGILFAINNGVVSQEGLSAEELKRLTMNGQVITANSITADKINVTDLFAQNITSTGNFNMGGKGALVYDAASDTLSIRAKAITLGSSGVATTEDVEGMLGGYYTKGEADAAIKVSADGITSQITSLGARVSTVEQTATSLTSRIASAEGNISTLQQTADGFTVKIDSIEDTAAAAQSTANTANSTANTANTNATTALNRATNQYGTCATAAATAAKVVTLSGFALFTGATIQVKFTYANSVASPTLNVNSTGAKAIRAYGAALTASSAYNWVAGSIVTFVYDGTYWNISDAAALSKANTAKTTATTANTNATTALKRGVEYIVGTQTAATNAWTGVTTETALYAGKTIAYKLPYAGNGSAATLNLTLAGGGTTGAKTIYRLTSAVTTHYPAGTVITMTYDGTYWRITDYNSDTYDRVRYNQAIKCGTAAIAAANIIVGTGGLYKHLKAGTAFDISYPILYAGSAIAASGTGTNNYLCLYFTVTTTQSITLTAYKPVYIKGKLSGSTFTPVSTAPLTQTVPTSNDGYYYIHLGHAITSTTMYLLPEHPIYTYFNGSFKAVTQIAVEAAKTATNFLSYDATNGLLIGNKSSGSWSGYRAQVLPTAFNILDASGNKLASYGASDIYLGNAANLATIHLCGDVGRITTSDNAILRISTSTQYFVQQAGGTQDFDKSAHVTLELMARNNSTNASLSGGIFEARARNEAKWHEATIRAEAGNNLARPRVRLYVAEAGGSSEINFNTAGLCLSDGSLYLTTNNKGIYAADAGGTDRDIIRLNASNTLIIGYGNYTQKDGDVNIDGGWAVNLYVPGYSVDATGVRMRTGTSETYEGVFHPTTNANVALGGSSTRWYRLYQELSTISTSDRRQKKNIHPLKKVKKVKKRDNGKTEEVDLYSELFDRLEPVEYNFLHGEKRKDCGLIAQDVLEAMRELDIAEDELDLVHHDTWVDEETGEKKDAFGIAYENLIAILIHEVQKLKSQVA